jgi:hypothetical protein
MVRLKRSSSNEEGWMLIEVIMGAVLVLLVTVALLDGFDSSSKASSIDKQRSIASSLAQTDQERMRTYTVQHLSNLRAVVPVAQTTVGGVAYTVTERADWVNDNSGIANCTSSDTQGSYIEITSTVTWKSMGATVPVTASSLVSPPVGAFGPGQGTVAVQVLDSGGNPVSGIPVSLGPSYNDVTDDNGCAVFGYIPSGPYVAKVTRSGWVDWGGNSPAQMNCAAPDGSTTVCTITMDVATTLNLAFLTQSYGSTSPTDPAVAGQATLANSGMNPPPPDTQLSGRRPVPATPITPTSPLPAPNIFPFSSGYTGYAGYGCPEVDPSWTGWATTTGSNVGTPSKINSLVPGGPPQTFKIVEPSMLFQVSDANSKPAKLGSLIVINGDSACNVGPATLQLGQNNGAGAADGQVDKGHTGFPFGHYYICAKTTTPPLPAPPPNGKIMWGEASVDNDNITGAGVPITMTSTTKPTNAPYSCPT